MFALTIALSVLPANLAQDPIPTPIPTPEGETCDDPGSTWLSLKENDTSISDVIHEQFDGQPIYAFECLSKDPGCPIIGDILGYDIAYLCIAPGVACFRIPLLRPLRSGEYIAVYAYPSPGYRCWWGVYRVAGALYLPLLFK
jgi:hypothetical protein